MMADQRFYRSKKVRQNHFIMIKEFSHLTYHVVDAFFTGIPHAASVYAVKSKTGDAAIWDTGTPRNYDLLKKQLYDIGITKDNLTKIVLSHIHMDHTGNASQLVKDFPNAMIYVHPRGARHVENPEIIIREARKVMQYNYELEYKDKVVPVPKDRIIQVKDGTTLEFGGGASVELIYAPGHAYHHLAWIDKKAHIALTGDSFGNVYDDIAKNVGFAITSPAAFDPDAWTDTITRIMNMGTESYGVAHYGFHDNTEQNYNQLMKWLKRMKEIALKEKEENIPAAVFDEYAKLFGANLVKNDDQLQINYKTGLIGVQIYHKMVKANKVHPRK